MPSARRLAFALTGCLFLVSLSEAEEQSPIADTLDLAKASLRQGDYEEAIRSFKKAARLTEGECLECSIGLSRAYNRSGNYSKALKSSRAVVKAEPPPEHLADALTEMGLALLGSAGPRHKRKPLLEAEKTFHRVLSLELTEIHGARLYLAEALIRLNRDPDAKLLLDEFLDAVPDSKRAQRLLSRPYCARETCAPDFQFITSKGEAIKSKDLLGKVVVFDFWATWRAPCREALPQLRRLVERYAGDDRFILISISLDADEGTLQSCRAEDKMEWTQNWDENKVIRNEFSVTSLPTYLIVDHRGVVLYRLVGAGFKFEQGLHYEIHKAVNADVMNTPVDTRSESALGSTSGVAVSASASVG
jgi:thiol-disulfide isomerase/thioredoxin